MTLATKPTGHDQVLNDDQLNTVSGGDAMTDAQREMQTMQMLMSAVSDVLKNIGQALNTAARKA